MSEHKTDTMEVELTIRHTGQSGRSYTVGVVRTAGSQGNPGFHVEDMRALVVKATEAVMASFATEYPPREQLVPLRRLNAPPTDR